MHGYLSADSICSEKRTVFRERSSRKTVSYEEQIMSKDKYPSIFSPQMEAIVFIILQIFFATSAIFKIGEYLTIIHQSGGKYTPLSPTLGWIYNSFSIYHTSWITSGPKSNFICDNMPTKAILFLFGCSEVNSTWLITSELANQRARKILFTCVVYTKTRYCTMSQNDLKRSLRSADNNKLRVICLWYYFELLIYLF